MKALIYHGIKNISFETLPDPVCGKKDVIVKTKKAGICGSDVTAYLYGGQYVGILPENQFGHEMVGEVAEVGSLVKDIKIGDRVFVNPVLCKKAPGMGAMIGAFSEYVHVENAKLNVNVFSIPKKTSYDETVITEPLTVATRGKNVVGTSKKDNVVVYGAGPIGLCCLSALLSMGCKNPVIVDINESRLKLAKKMGGVVFNSSKGDLYAFLKTHFGVGHTVFGVEVPNVDVYIDCAGAINLPGEILANSKYGAKLSCVGVYKHPVEIDFAPVIANELTIKGSCPYTPIDITEALGYVFKHKSVAPQIVTHHFKYKDAIKAFEFASNPAKNSVKVVLDFE